MATNLAIDPELLNRALEVGGERTKRLSTKPCATGREQEHLFGKLDPEYDYKRERTR